MSEPVPLTVQGVTPLRAWDHGGEGLPLVVFVHGFLDTGRSFDDVCQALSGVARCVALTWRGHGQSRTTGPGASFHLLDHVKDLTLALPDLESRLGPLALLLGHSMGGNAALIHAGTLPDRVPRLVLLDALGPPPEEATEQPARLRRMLTLLGKKQPFSPAANVAEAKARLMRHNVGLTDAGAERMVRHALISNDDGTVSFPFGAELRGPTPVRYPEAMWLKLCGNVTAQTVVVRCAQGYVPDDEMVQARVAAMGARFVTWDAPHHAHVERVDDVAALVREQLSAERP